MKNSLFSVALALTTPLFVVFGRMSDRIGRKPVIEQEMFDRLGIAYSPRGIGVDDTLRINLTAPFRIIPVIGSLA